MTSYISNFDLSNNKLTHNTINYTKSNNMSEINTSNDLSVNDVSNNNTINELNTTFESWEDENVHFKPKLLRGIYSYGFDKPSPIQQRAIIPMMSNRDIIAQAQSGTGKTGAFCLGSLQKVDESIDVTQVIILSPTRELSIQNYNVCKALGQFTKTRIHLLIGGTSTDVDKETLTNNTPHIVVGCPGRIHDMFRRGFLSGKHLKLFVLDEADEMLSSGFKDQIYNIFQYLNNDVQIGLFSATMPLEVQNLTEKFMRDPIKILVKSEMLTLEGIKQYYIAIDDDHFKYLTIKDLFQTVSLSQTIIYCNSVKRVQDLHDAMNQDGFPVICIHSGMNDSERREAFNVFKSGQKRVLISSDVTARGIDIQQLSVVINFDIPKSVHTYLHRIGRSGRWGRKGLAINFITRQDMPKLKELESWYQTHIDELPADFADSMRKV
jgi:translation initiation factor 4A